MSLVKNLVFETSLGQFVIELNHEAAPITSAYFLAHAESRAFDGASFFRIVAEDNASLRATVPIEVIQGGLREADPQNIAPIRHEPTRETGLRHKQWTVSAARFDPGRTYGSFFICMRDEPALDHGGARHPDGLGFAAFGQVSEGREVVTGLFQRREKDEMLSRPIPIIRVIAQ